MGLNPGPAPTLVDYGSPFLFQSIRHTDVHSKDEKGQTMYAVLSSSEGQITYVTNKSPINIGPAASPHMHDKIHHSVIHMPTSTDPART